MKNVAQVRKEVFILRQFFFSSEKMKQLFARLYLQDLGKSRSYQQLWNLGDALTRQEIPLAASLFEEESGDAEVDSVIKAFLPLKADNSDWLHAPQAIALSLGFQLKPEQWQMATDERGRGTGIKHLSDHSDMSLSSLFPLPAAISEWKKRYPALSWGCPPMRGTRPSGVKGWAWNAHVKAWEADFA